MLSGKAGAREKREIAEESPEFTQSRQNVKAVRVHLEEIVKNTKAFTAAAQQAQQTSKALAESMVRFGEAVRADIGEADALGVAMRTCGGAFLSVQDSYQNFLRDTSANLMQAISTFLETDVKEYRAKKKTYYKARANYVGMKQKTQQLMVKEKLEPIKIFENTRMVNQARKTFFDLTTDTENRMIVIEDASHWFVLEKLQNFSQAFIDYATDQYGTWHELEGYVNALGEYSAQQHANAEEDRRCRMDELRAREEEREKYKYQALVDMLSHPDLVVLEAVVDVLRDDCDMIIEKVLQITDTYNQSIPLIKVGITAEIASTEDPATLFRSNNVHTKLISIYTKVVGQTYLENTIGSMLTDFLTNPTEVEIDPNRLDFSLSDEEKQGIIDTNMTNLKRICQGFFDRIVNSLNQCPIPMREICNHLQREIWDRFPQNRQTAVGGYVFLRFFCPAIMSPEKVGLASSPAEPPMQRRLILITKVLQNLSNCRQFGQKERFMGPMNEFIFKNLERTKTFFNSLSRLPADLGDFSPMVSLKEVHDKYLPEVQVHLTQNIDTLGRRIVEVHPKEGRQLLNHVCCVLADLDPQGKIKCIVPVKQK